MTRSLTRAIAAYVVGRDVPGLPPEISERAAKITIDELAGAYFCRRSAPAQLAARYALSMGGAPEALVLGTGSRTSAAYAALANGTAGHGEEVDGAHVVGGHPGASIVQAAMCMAERQSSTGADLIGAVALGYEIGTRLVAACGGKFRIRDDLHMTSDFLYAYGCTAAACRLLGLDETRVCHAFALVSFQTNGLYALYSEDRHISKSFCNGQFAFAGISAALMAAAGLEGNEDIFGSPDGVLAAWGLQDGRDVLLEGLGSKHAVTGANFKFFNAGYPIHTPVEATLHLLTEHALHAEDLTRIEVGMPENAMRVVDNRKMHNICVQDMLAATIVRGGLQLRDRPFPGVLADPRFQTLRAMIEVRVDPEINAENPDGRGARVTLQTRDGLRVSHRVDSPRGHSCTGDVSWQDLREKWQGNLMDCDSDGLVDLGERLETLDDVSQLSQKLSGVMA